MALRTDCACGSGLPYATCCEPFHRGVREAPDAASLMRSRYAAYARGDADYLWKTLHPDHEDRARPRDVVLREMRDAFRQFRYMGLRVLDHSPPDADGLARVLFLARVFEKGRNRTFVERSDFFHDGTGWRYHSGATIPAAMLPNPAESYTLATFPEVR